MHIKFIDNCTRNHATTSTNLQKWVYGTASLPVECFPFTYELKGLKPTVDGYFGLFLMSFPFCSFWAFVCLVFFCLVTSCLAVAF